ncbi:MAG: oligopeptidase B [Flammeovirgaceae bacterium]|nr:oligopeptidase B [Flammeovirgaceae bacterium]|tara:strand:- start:2933 stop:4984 length:2052 start_codon:yes stop_codon:yes gene_type:complete
MKNKLREPIAEKIEKKLSIHGDTRIDEYYWLNQRGDKNVINYLNAENAYRDEYMQDYKNLEEELFLEIKSRIKEDDSSVPYLDNGYYYYTRYEKNKQYPIYCRKKGDLKSDEEILIDVNIMSEGYEYFRVGDIEISPNDKIMAYSVDTLSRRIYTIYFMDLETREVHKKNIKNTSGSITWANDSETVFYNLRNIETLRTEKVMKHNLNSSSKDQEIYFEEDETFSVYSYKTKTDKYIVIGSSATLSQEFRYLDANNPNGDFKIFQERINGLEYSITHFDDKWFIRTNKDGATNFKLMVCNENKTKSSSWKDYIPHRENVLLEDADFFKNHMVVTEREEGLRKIEIRPWNNVNSHYIEFDDEAYSVRSSTNAEINSEKFRYSYSSMTTPNSVIEYDMNTKEKTILKETEVLGGTFDKNNYISRRVWAPSRDGKKVPISLVYRKDKFNNGENPLLLYGYGSYGITNNASFSSVRLSLLDRGFVYAIAHIRGSQYLGRDWYNDGKMFKKKNTFYDFIDSGKFLIKEGFAHENKLFAMGGSAGGLLMGAVVNMAPELFRGIVAGVPFVDVVTTMLDDDIPLTTFEYDEWGNPNNKDSYDYMLSYSPYDQVEEKNYPAIFITTGYHDSQVQYFEPAKWIARLRDRRTNKEPLLMYCNMDAGHGGASGRFEAYKETAMEYAFFISLLDN